jgi:hypothetical protein
MMLLKLGLVDAGSLGALQNSFDYCIIMVTYLQVKLQTEVRLHQH